ncbi:uncharacterized protein [Atheta coriaria]|uniref:uncharacterized protein n=1 Tax=Dalotia coriaria TaxID=877792 RepID=UPI0031F44CE8
MLQLKSFCCGLSLRHGTIIIGVTSSVLSFIILILSAAYAEHPHELLDMSDPSIQPDTQVLKIILITIAVGSALQCIFSIFLIFAAETNRPILLLPWIGFGPVCLAFYVLGTLIAIIHHSSDNNAIFITAHLMVTTICTAVASYKFLTVYSLYKHLRSLNF